MSEIKDSNGGSVGERCELMHEVNLLDIDIDLGDVMSLADVIAAIAKC